MVQGKRIQFGQSLCIKINRKLSLVFQKHRSSNDQKAQFSKAYSNKTQASKKKSKSRGKSGKRSGKGGKGNKLITDIAKKQAVKGIECFCVGYGFDEKGEQMVCVQAAFMSRLEILIMRKPKVLGDASPDWMPTAQLNVKHVTKNTEYTVNVPIEYTHFAMPQCIIPPTPMLPVMNLPTSTTPFMNLPPPMPQFVLSPIPMMLPKLERSVDGNKGARYKKEGIKTEQQNF